MNKIEIQNATRKAAKALYSSNKDGAATLLKPVIKQYKSSVSLLLPADQDSLLSGLLKIAVKLEDASVAAEFSDIIGLRMDMLNPDTLALLTEVHSKNGMADNTGTAFGGSQSKAVKQEVESAQVDSVIPQYEEPPAVKDQITDAVKNAKSKLQALQTYMMKKSNILLHNKHLPVWILVIAVVFLYRRKNINLVQSIKDFVAAGMNILGV